MALTLDGNTVLEKSPLNMSVDGSSITSGVKTGKINRSTVNEKYPWFGYHSTAKNHFNGYSISFKNKEQKINYTLEIRVFNDAAGFRFIIPGNENSLRTPDESHLPVS